MLGLDCCRLKDSFVIPKAFCGLIPRNEEGTKAEVAAAESTTNRAVVENFMMKRAGTTTEKEQLSDCNRVDLCEM
jgi:hypothetical protein